jgi:hypothetical protein
LSVTRRQSSPGRGMRRVGILSAARQSRQQKCPAMLTAFYWN